MKVPAEDDQIQLDSIIFSSASTEVNRFHREAARTRLSVRSRLHSIVHDADFVQKIAEHYSLPLVANERCGSWYVAPERKAGSVYFKSTDGHFGQWRFSTRRLNLHLLDLIARHDGCIIVDSTRRGKSMPDAMSKTVPIWIAVVNRLLFPGDAEAGKLHTPPDVVSESEHAQIESRLDEHVEEVRRLKLDLEGLQTKLVRPLRPLWVTQTAVPATIEDTPGFYPVILCTASGRDVQLSNTDFDYAQGAADDAEAWACGLTPDLFWQHQAVMLAGNDDDLESIVRELVSGQPPAIAGAEANLIRPTKQIFVGASDIVSSSFNAVIACGPSSTEPEGESSSQQLCLPCPTGKLGSRALRNLLPSILPFLDNFVSRSDGRLLVTCTTGDNLSVGVALAILCLYVSEEGKLQSRSFAPVLNKDFIKRRMSWIMVCIPDANPSRATLQSVNAFLLGGTGGGAAQTSDD